MMTDHRSKTTECHIQDLGFQNHQILFSQIELCSKCYDSVSGYCGVLFGGRRGGKQGGVGMGGWPCCSFVKETVHAS